MLAALAITSAMVVAALRVVGRLSRFADGSGPADERAALISSLAGPLGADMVHAERCRLVPGGVEVQTRCALNADTLELEHLRSSVVYRVRQVGPRLCLVRTQQVGSDDPHAELVCCGIGAIEIPIARKKRSGWVGLGDVVRVVVKFGKSDQAGHTFVFRKR